MKTLGDRLKYARKEKGFTQADLARVSGVSQQMISKLESGKSNSTSEVVALARAVGRSSEWLNDGEEILTGQGDKRPGQAPQPSGAGEWQSQPDAPRTIAGLLQAIHPELDSAHRDIREAIDALVLTYQTDPKEGERVAKAIKTLLKKDT